jgi:hypothetical protein
MSLITVFSRKKAHGLISEILEISPLAYYRVKTVSPNKKLFVFENCLTPILKTDYFGN